MPKIRIKAKSVEMTAELNDSETAKKLWEVLPVMSSAQVWGREVYFEIPVDMPEKDAQAKVPSGTIAYWPVGKCFCIFFGQTPYSPVNVLGKLDGDPDEFAKVESGEEIHIEKAE